MAMKLSIGFQKKLGLPDYGSAGASCQVEFEIDAGSLRDNLEGFHEKAQRAFAACQQAVNDQLARQSPTSGKNGHAPPGNGAGGSNGSHANGSHANGSHTPSNGVRPATASQVRAIRAIASKQRLDLQNLLEQRFGVGRVENLRLSDASTLIDELKNGGEG